MRIRKSEKHKEKAADDTLEFAAKRKNLNTHTPKSKTKPHTHPSVYIYIYSKDGIRGVSELSFAS